MNISFKTISPELDAKLITEAGTVGMSGLKGHRDLGGIRASIYNAFPVDGCVRFAEFLQTFAANN